MKTVAQALEDLIWVTQLGLSLMMPLLLFMGASYWLTTAKGVGLWVYIPALLLGIGTGASSFMHFWQLMQRRNAQKEKAKPPTISFNQHD